MIVVDGIDYADAVVLTYPKTKRMGILTATMQHKSPEAFCRIEGSRGEIVISGPGASLPRVLEISVVGKETTVKKYDHPGMGFYFEADAAALDIRKGRTENGTMPLEETIRMLRMMDGMRREGRVVYPQDDA